MALDTLDNQLIWTNFLLWIEATLFILIIAWMSFKFSKERGASAGANRERNLFLWGCFFFILAISNVLILTWRFAVTEIPLAVEILERGSNALFYFACFVRVFDIEKRVFEKKRYYFSIILGITVLINLIVPPNMLKTISPWQIAFLVIVTAGYSVFPIIYFQLFRKSVGKIRANAMKVSAGAIFLAVGYLFRPENLVAYRLNPFFNMVIDIFYITAPIAVFIGAYLIYDSYRKVE